jgi:uncharacterized membrane protein YebE (DUF533 family)
MPDTDARALALAWYYREQFGFKRPPPITDPEVVHNMARALVSVAGADHFLSDAERAWILGYLATKGYPDAVLEDVKELGPADAPQVAELMQLGILGKSGRILLYDAIRAASVDGYSVSERKSVRRIAAALAISDKDVDAIESLVEEEAAIKQKRIALLMPGGHPNL